VDTEGYGNMYASFAGSGASSSKNYLLATNNAGIKIPSTAQLVSMEITNSTYAALSMKNGDGFAKKFTGKDKDFFKVWVKGYNIGKVKDSVEVYLANFQYADSSQNFIQKEWKTVDLSKNDKSAQNLSFIREAYSDLASSFALSGQYYDGWNYFRESVRNKELLEKYELSAAQVAKDRGHYKIAEFFYGKLLSKSPTASFARDLSIDRAENAKKSGNLELYAEKLADLMRDYGAGSAWLKAQKFDSNTEKQMVDDLVSIIRRDAKNFHQAAQKKNNPAQLKRVKPLYVTYFAFVPEKASDTKENVHEMRYYFSDLLYEAGEYIQSANEYKKVGAGKYETIAAFNRILCFREAAKADKKYNDDLLAATNDFVSQYPNDKRAGDLMYASANQAFESGSQDQSVSTLRAIISRFANTERGVDAAERILFLDEKNENFDAVLKDANEFAANATLMATGGEKFKDMISDVRKKAVVKKVEKMPESDKSEQAAKAAAFLSVSAQVSGDLKEKKRQLRRSKHVRNDGKHSCNSHVVGIGRYLFCDCVRHDWLDDLHNTERRR
jgi:hypothetical protein